MMKEVKYLIQVALAFCRTPKKKKTKVRLDYLVTLFTDCYPRISREDPLERRDKRNTSKRAYIFYQPPFVFLKGSPLALVVFVTAISAYTFTLLQSVDTRFCYPTRLVNLAVLLRFAHA